MSINIRKTKIDWSNFNKLRDDRLRIRGAQCKRCRVVLFDVKNKRLSYHRQRCGMPNQYENIARPTELESDNESMDVEDIKNIVDKKLALALYACSIPFKVVENKYFIDLIKTLCRLKFDYKIPCRQTISSSILHEVERDIENQKIKLLENTDSVMMVDGWKNKSKNRKYLVFTLRNINVDQLFLTSFDTSLESEFGEILAENIENAIALAKEKYKTNVFAIITDNDSKIVSGARLARNEHNVQLWQATCSSHSGNLLLKSLVDADFAKKVRDVVTAFREPRFESLLIRLGGTKLKNYPDTRFCYFRDSCKSVTKNLQYLQNICSLEDINLNEDIANDIFDLEFRNRLRIIEDALDPICNLINHCQTPRCNIADAVQHWLSLRLPSDEYNDVISYRINKAIWPVGFCANFLHHKYQGLLLDEEQVEIAKNFITHNLDPHFLHEFKGYVRKKNEFQEFADNCDEPFSYWTFCEFNFPNLANFAKKLFLIPASTALIEGLFSNWTYIHSDYRNRLANCTSNQLINIYHSLKCINLKYKYP